MTAPDPKDLPAVAARLIQTIDGLTEAIHDLLRRTSRSETQLKIMWVVVGLVVFLAGGMSLTYYQQAQTDRSLTATRSELCSLYSVFLGSYNPSTRQAGPDRDAYEAAFVSFREGYLRLECTSPFVPPATPRSSPPPR